MANGQFLPDVFLIEGCSPAIPGCVFYGWCEQVFLTNKGELDSVAIFRLYLFKVPKTSRVSS